MHIKNYKFTRNIHMLRLLAWKRPKLRQSVTLNIYNSVVTNRKWYRKPNYFEMAAGWGRYFKYDSEARSWLVVIRGLLNMLREFWLIYRQVSAACTRYDPYRAIFGFLNHRNIKRLPLWTFIIPSERGIPFHCSLWFLHCTICFLRILVLPLQNAFLVFLLDPRVGCLDHPYFHG